LRTCHSFIVFFSSLLAVGEVRWDGWDEQEPTRWVNDYSFSPHDAIHPSVHPPTSWNPYPSLCQPASDPEAIYKNLWIFGVQGREFKGSEEVMTMNFEE
jgi:hypothetical protein